MRAAVTLLLNVLCGVSVTSNMSILYVSAGILRVPASSAPQRRVFGTHATGNTVSFEMTCVLLKRSRFG